MYVSINIKIEHWSICAYNAQEWHPVEGHACYCGNRVDIRLEM